MSRQESDGYDGFLSRWSRRKSEATKSSEAPQTPELSTAEQTPDQLLEQNLQATLDKAQAIAQPDAAQVQTNPGELATSPTDVTEPATDLAQEEPAEPLPDLETLTPESDFRPFMASNVNRQVRNLALRKLFKAAVFGHRDGLDDYDEDFTTFEPLGDTITADMRHHAERKERLAREAQEEQERLANAQLDDESTDDITDDVEGDEADNSNAEQLAQTDSDNPSEIAGDEIRHTLNSSDAGAQEQPVMVGKLRRQTPDSTNKNKDNDSQDKA